MGFEVERKPCGIRPVADVRKDTDVCVAFFRAADITVS